MLQKKNKQPESVLKPASLYVSPKFLSAKLAFLVPANRANAVMSLAEKVYYCKNGWVNVLISLGFFLRRADSS